MPYDVIVAGLGPGGASAAEALGRAGLHVLALERESFPRYKPCGGCLSRKIDHLLPPDFHPLIEKVVYGGRLIFRFSQELVIRSPEPVAYEEIMMRRWLKMLISLSVLLPLLMLLATRLGKDPKRIPFPLLGKPAPSFTLQLFDGETLRLQELQGQVVVVNFWASWCYPACWNEAPRLEAAWKRYKIREWSS